MKKDRTEEALKAHFTPHIAAEELAKRKGVQLAKAPAPPPPAPAPLPDTWFARNMPAVAQLLADMKAQLPPELWKEAIDRMRKGGGYAVDLRAGLAIGGPPLEVWRRGKVAEREGFPVMRVTPLELAALSEAEGRAMLRLLEFGVPIVEDVPQALAAIAARVPQLVREFPDLAWPAQVLHP